MRIVGGRLGGRRLVTPRGQGVTRPTSERVREAVASALDARDRIEGAVVLDLFAGTGALAFEALSRGAASAVMVDRDGAMVRAMRESARHLGLAREVQVVSLDLERPPESWLPRLPDGPFDLVFLDPPYARVALAADALAALWSAGRLRPEATAVVEHDRRRPSTLPPDFGEIATYRYGDTAVILCAAPSSPDDPESPRGSP
jgi:16S rRNA (guanine966-N2)-methyltransferase